MARPTRRRYGLCASVAKDRAGARVAADGVVGGSVFACQVEE